MFYTTSLNLPLATRHDIFCACVRHRGHNIFKDHTMYKKKKKIQKVLCTHIALKCFLSTCIIYYTTSFNRYSLMIYRQHNNIVLHTISGRFVSDICMGKRDFYQDISLQRFARYVSPFIYIVLLLPIACRRY